VRTNVSLFLVEVILKLDQRRAPVQNFTAIVEGWFQALYSLPLIAALPHKPLIMYRHSH